MFTRSHAATSHKKTIVQVTWELQISEVKFKFQRQASTNFFLTKKYINIRILGHVNVGFLILPGTHVLQQARWLTAFNVRALFCTKTVATPHQIAWLKSRCARNKVYASLLRRNECLRTQGKHFQRVSQIWSVESNS